MKYFMFGILSLAVAVLAQTQPPMWLCKVRVTCDKETYQCLGATVSDNMLITTASCVNQCAQPARKIRAFCSNGVMFNKKIKVMEVIFHPNNATHNIALVKLACHKHKLVNVALESQCGQVDAQKLHIFNYAQTSSNLLVSTAKIGRKRDCRSAHNWDQSVQACIAASTCLAKSGALITSDDHGILYGLPAFLFDCNAKNETKLASALICKCYDWIQKAANGASCKQKPSRVIIPPNISPSSSPTTMPTTSTSSQSTSPPTECDEPPNIANGRVIYDSLTTGSVAVYECGRGYEMKGKKRLKCIRSEWNNEPPACAAKNCSTPPGMLNGMVSYDDLQFGSKATYKCNTGYELKGGDTLTCEIPGKWNKRPPSCQEVAVLMCSNPPPVLKALVDIPENREEGAVAKYTCHPRYKLEGSQTLVCKNGQWAGDLPRCIDCQEIGHLNNGNLTILLNASLMLIVKVKCDKGYVNDGSDTNRCSNGKWQFPIAKCESVKCPVPEEIPVGSMRYTGLTFQSLAIYSCPSGYSISGYQQRACKADKTWAGTPPKCIEDSKLFCKQFDRIPCGSTANLRGRSIGATVTYEPSSNFQLMGAAKITCMPNGKWSAPAPTCRIMCPMNFDLKDGDYSLIMNDDTPDYDMVMTCNDGFNMNGVKEFTCKGGLWNRAPSQTKCKRGCKCLKVKNGKASCYEDFGLMFATVTCNRGYNLIGRNPGMCIDGDYVIEPTCNK